MTNYKHMPLRALHPPFRRFALFIFKTITRHTLWLFLINYIYLLKAATKPTEKNVCGKQWKEAATETDRQSHTHTHTYIYVYLKARQKPVLQLLQVTARGGGGSTWVYPQDATAIATTCSMSAHAIEKVEQKTCWFRDTHTHTCIYIKLYTDIPWQKVNHIKNAT